MTVGRTPTKYQRLHNENSNSADAMELQDNPQYTYTPRTFDAILEEVKVNTHAITKSSFGEQHSYLTEQQLRPSIQQRALAGWRAGVLASLIGAATVCIFNTVITLWVWKNPNHIIEGSVGTLFRGSCEKARGMSVWIHLLVNVLSTLLLVASNYCMQVLSAPNRQELVRAHAQRYWLHIGVPSLRNLTRIGRDRAALWVVLFLSSVPLHLLFNSAVFVDLQANKYAVIPTTEDWLRGGRYDTSGFLDVDETALTVDEYGYNESCPFYYNRGDRLPCILSMFEDYRINLGDEEGMAKYKELNPAECFDQYNEQYVSEVGNVYLIQESATVWHNPSEWYPKFDREGNFTWVSRGSQGWYANNRSVYTNEFPFISEPGIYPSNPWRCSSQNAPCDVENEFEVPPDRSKWAPYGSPVKSCLIEQVEELCRLQFNLPIALAVIISNLIKAVCMALTLILYKNHAALVTIGDAIASFLDHPDPETRNRCLHSRRLVEAEWNWENSHGAKKDELGIEPERFIPKTERWARAPGGGRWLATYLLYFVAVIAGIVFMAKSLAGMPKDPVKLWKIGFGSVSGSNLLNMGTALMGGVLLANLPQAMLSYLYLAFNALYTNMFVAKEWSTYYNNRKPLRVTSPIGQQRGTYWLNVPFRYAVPMTVVSGLFHWLASQSIFLVRITVTKYYPQDGSRIVDEGERISTCGYSPSAIILTFVTGSVIAIGGILMGRYLKYPPGMPMAASCSAAISAACHPPPEDDQASLLPVQWGAVTHGETRPDGKEPVGHCTFSSLPVERPIMERLYA